MVAISQLHIAPESKIPEILPDVKLDSGRVDYNKFMRTLIEEESARPVASDLHLNPNRDLQTITTHGFNLSHIPRTKPVLDSQGVSQQEKYFDQTKIFDQEQTNKEKLSISGNRMAPVPGHPWNDSKFIEDSLRDAPADQNVYVNPTFKSHIFSNDVKSPQVSKLEIYLPFHR
jgi:hypothetical protein